MSNLTREEVDKLLPQGSAYPPPDKPSWLIPDLLPYGALSFLIGDEGIGKSAFAYLLAAIFSSGRGHEGLGIQPGAPGDVLMWCTEDDLRGVALSTIAALGGDLHHVRPITLDWEGSQWRDLTLETEEFIIDSTLAIGAPSLIIVDNFVDALPPLVQQKNAEQLRVVLNRLKRIARRTGAAVLGLGHTNRSNAANSRDQWAGSSEYRKASRVALMAKDNEDGETFTIGVDKTNMTRARRAIVMRHTTTPTPIHYAGEPKPVMADIHTVEYVCESERSIRELVEDKANGDIGGDEISDTTATLLTYLADHGGSSTRKAVLDALKGELTKDQLAKTVQRARRAGLIQAGKNGVTAVYAITSKGYRALKGADNAPILPTFANVLPTEKQVTSSSFAVLPVLPNECANTGGGDTASLPPLWRELRGECLDDTALAPLSTVYGQLTPATRGAHSKEDIQLELDRMIEAGLVEQDREGRYKRR